MMIQKFILKTRLLIFDLNANFAFIELNSINIKKFLGPHIFIRNNNKYLTPVFEIICEVIKTNEEVFSEKFKNFLCKKILPDCSEISGRHIQLFTEALGTIIIKNFHTVRIGFITNNSF